MKRHFTQISIVICLLMVLSVFFGCGSGTTDNGDDDYDPRPIACFGDSLTYGTGAPEGQSYPDFLQRRIRVEVINAGVSGDTTALGLARLDDVLSKDPQIVIIEFGANDLFRNISVAQIETNLKEIITRLDNGNRKIYVADWLPDTDSIVNNAALVAINALRLLNGLPAISLTGLSNYISEYQNALDSISKNYNVEIIEGVFKGIFGNQALMSNDQIHPNSKGYEVMADNYFREIKPYLQANNLLK